MKITRRQLKTLLIESLLSEVTSLKQGDSGNKITIQIPAGSKYHVKTQDRTQTSMAQYEPLIAGQEPSGFTTPSGTYTLSMVDSSGNVYIKHNGKSCVLEKKYVTDVEGETNSSKRTARIEKILDGANVAEYKISGQDYDMLALFYTGDVRKFKSNAEGLYDKVGKEFSANDEWLGWFERNKDKKIVKQEEEAAPEEQEDSKEDKKDTPSDSPQPLSKVAYIRQAIGDDSGGDWNEETDVKWKEWLSANENRNLFCIGQNGVLKGVELSNDDLQKAFVDNNAASLAIAAGYKGTVKGVYQMVKECEDLQDRERVSRANLYGLGGGYPEELEDTQEGETEIAAEKEEEKIEETTSDEQLDKVKEQPNSDKWLKRALERLANQLEKAKGKNRDGVIKSIRNAVKRLKRKFPNADKKYFAYIESQLETESLPEALSRGSIYRRRYGRY